MNKDALLASGIGFGIGLLITGAILLGPTLVTQVTTRRPTPTGDVQSGTQQALGANTNNGTPSTAITIDSPSPESIITQENVEVAGKAPEGSIIVIAGEVDETVLTVDSTGTFKGAIALKEGKNEISVSGILNGNPTVQKQVVFYTP